MYVVLAKHLLDRYSEQLNRRTPGADRDVVPSRAILQRRQYSFVVPSHDRAIVAPSRVIDPEEFDARVSSMLEEITEVTPEHLAESTSAAQSGRMRQAREATKRASRVLPTIGVQHPGRRGALSYRVKQQVRRALYWYVEPSWREQQQLDYHLLRSSTEATELLVQLRHEVDGLTLQLELLATAVTQVQRQLVETDAGRDARSGDGTA